MQAPQVCLSEVQTRRHRLANVDDQRLVGRQVVMLLRVVPGMHLIAELEVAEVGSGLLGQDADPRASVSSSNTKFGPHFAMKTIDFANEL